MARQTAALPAVPLGLLLLYRRQFRDLFAALTFASLLAPAVCFLWLYQTDGLPTGFGRMQYDWVLLFTPKGLVAEFLSLLLELAFLIWPVAWLSGGGGTRRLRWTRWNTAAAGLWFALIAAGAAELHPYRGYTLSTAVSAIPRRSSAWSRPWPLRELWEVSRRSMP